MNSIANNTFSIRAAKKRWVLETLIGIFLI